MHKKMSKLTRMGMAAVCLLMLQIPAAYAQAITLQESVDMALRNNLAIQIAQKDQEKSELALIVAKGGAQPSVNLNRNYSWQKSNGFPAESGTNTSIGMSISVYDGNKTKNKIKEARQTIDSSVISVEKSKQDVILNVISAYYTVLANRNAVQVARETVDNYAKHLATVQSMYQVGVSPKMDVLNSQVQLADARQTLFKDQNSYETAVTSFKTIVRYNSGEPLEFIDAFPAPQVSRTLADCMDAAVKNQPTVGIAKINIAKAQSELDIAKAGKQPSVSLSASTGWNHSVLPQDNSFTLGIAANWNIFDGHITDSEIKQAEVSLEQARMTLAQQEDSIKGSVQEYYLNMKEAGERFTSTQTTVAQATENYYIACEKYKAGEGVMLDIIDAQLSLTTAKMNYIQAQYDYAVNKAKLANAMGIASLNKGDF